MAHIHIPHDLRVRYLDRSGRVRTIGLALTVVGLVGFVVALITDAQYAWTSYSANWLTFAAIAMGAVMVEAATTITKARWNWSIRRLGASFAAFLPIAFVLFLPMLGLREGYFPWIEEMAGDPILQAKRAWLNVPFLMVRNLVGVGVMFGLAVYFAYLAVRPDLDLARAASHDDAGRTRWRERLTTGWLGQEAEEVRSWQRMTVLAPALVVVYAAVMSILSFDFIMSLEPHWFSTLFGGWFFMGSFWGGLAAISVLMVWVRGQHQDYTLLMGLQQRHDIGKLTFAFCVFWTYLFWSQYLVIWYGKLPWEQAYLVHRSTEGWGAMSLLMIVLCFLIPFAGLLGRPGKLRPNLLAIFCSSILVGLWVERYVLVAPPHWEVGEPLMRIWHPLIACLFLGPLILSVHWFLSTFPVIQVWQPLGDPESVELERALGLRGENESPTGRRPGTGPGWHTA